MKCCFKKLDLTDSIEYCLVDLHFTCGSTINILSIYRPPNTNLASFCEELIPIIQLLKRGDITFICGDLNIDLLDPQSSEVDLIHSLCSFTFSPLVNLPTRVTESSGKCIDHIWTNSLGNFASGVIPHEITDHYAVFVECPILNDRELLSIKYHDCSPSRIINLKCKLEEFCTTFSVYDHLDISTGTKIFCDEFSRLYSNCCPVVTKMVSFKRFNKPWLSPYILSLINEKHRLFRLYKRGYVNFDHYNRMNLLVSGTLKRAKISYYKYKFASCVGNSGRSWKLINNLMNKKCKDDDIVLEDEGRRVCDAGGVAELFSNYFSCVASNLNSTIPVTNKCPMEFMPPRLPCTFFASPTNFGETYNLIKSMPSKGTYLYNVPSFIYKTCIDIVTPIVVDLFNNSLVVGEFPSCLRTGRVIPIFKKGSRNSVSNYRPITTLPIMSKIFEKLMHCRLY